MSNNNSDWVDYGGSSMPEFYTQADGTMDSPFDWDWPWQYGAQEGDQIASFTFRGAYDYSHANAPDTTFTSDYMTYVDQSPARALTDSHATSEPTEAINCSASEPLLSAKDISNGCACISCFMKERLELSRRACSVRYNCLSGCTYQCNIWDTGAWQKHLKTHFTQDKKYHCKAPQCGQIFGRWGELTRHDKTHCLRPKKFACDVVGCRYSGDNGFIRHDKLLSHKRNVHDGKAPPSQLMRRLQAKPRA